MQANEANEVTEVTEVTEAGSAEKQGRMWNARPRDWADISEPFGVPLFEAVFRELKVAHGRRHLDVGCGAGTASALAAKSGAMAAGLDAAEALIAIAKERVPDGDFRVGEMEALPFDDGAFDSVSGFNSFQFATNRVRALSEARRVTKRGGHLGFGVWALPQHCEAMKLMGALKPLFAASGAKHGHSNAPLATPGLLDDLLTTSGWRVTAEGEVSCPFEFPDVATAERGMLSAGGMSLEIQAPAEEIRRVFTEALAPYKTATGYRLENRFIYRIATH